MAVWVTQPMAKLVTLLEQHMEREPPTVAIQALPSWLMLKMYILRAFGLFAGGGRRCSLWACCAQWIYVPYTHSDIDECLSENVK